LLKVRELTLVLSRNRRQCPGRLLAEEILFLSMAALLSVFDIQKALDTDGRPIIPPGDFTDGGIM